MKLKHLGFLAALLLVLSMVVAPTANATVILTDRNSTVTIDPDTQAGVYNWQVDGVDQLYQQWFWYGVDGGVQRSINTIGTPSVSATGRVADIAYTDGNILVTITYTLRGGLAGSNTSDLAETISIDNLTSSAIAFRFYQYSDFDLDGTSSGDTVNISAAHNTVRQRGEAREMSETVVGPTPDHWEVGYQPDTLTSLNGALVYTLNDSVGPIFGDVTWAFEWDQTIGAGNTFIISKDKRIAPIPVPPSVLLLGSGILGLVGLGWRRRKNS